MNRNLRQFQSDSRKQDQFDTLDVNLASDTLFQLLEEKIFEIVVAGQERGEQEECTAADQQNGNQHDNSTRSDHSCPLDRLSSVSKPPRADHGITILPTNLDDLYYSLVVLWYPPLPPFHLAGGPCGMAHLLDHFGPALLEPWTRLDAPELTPELRDRVVAGAVQTAAGQTVLELQQRRDAFLVDLLLLLEAHRVGGVRTTTDVADHA